jgi:simple sugar transport system permease protein
MEQFLATTLRASAPIILVAMGGVFAYRAGIFHLGLEGLMIIGAFSAVAFTIWTDSWILGLIGAIAVCMFFSFVFWVVIVKLRANAIIAGLGLTGLGLGGAAYALNTIFNQRGAILSDQGLPRPITGVTEGPLVVLSEQSILVWATPFVVLICWVVLRRTRFGLRLAAVGEYPFAARSVGERAWWRWSSAGSCARWAAPSCRWGAWHRSARR